MESSERKEAYTEILSVLNKYPDLLREDYRIDITDKLTNRLFGVELNEQYGLKISPEAVQSTEWHRVDDHRFIGRYGEKYNRTIAWSDDGSQPEDELLLMISFPTGAYIFGEDYPTKLFQDFFLDLKAYGPKYVDTANHCLYFTIDSAANVYNAFLEIYKKYRERYKAEANQRKREALKAELAKLDALSQDGDGGEE